MRALLVILVSFAAMEPVAAISHRLLMHGPGWGWHRSHHRVRKASPFEANDLYPVCFAAVTVVAMAAATAGHLTSVLEVGVGVTMYGAAYTFVHDVCVHGRLTGGRPWLATGTPLLGAWLEWLAACHAVHHSHAGGGRRGGAPYGFLLPIVPARQRAVVSSFAPVLTRARAEKTS